MERLILRIKQHLQLRGVPRWTITSHPHSLEREMSVNQGKQVFLEHSKDVINVIFTSTQGVPINLVQGFFKPRNIFR